MGRKLGPSSPVIPNANCMRCIMRGASEHREFVPRHSSSEWPPLSPAAGSSFPTTSDSRSDTDCSSSPFQSLRLSLNPRRLRPRWLSRLWRLRTPVASEWWTVLPYSRVSSCCQLNSKYGGLTRPLCSSRITGLHCSYRTVRPSAPLRYSRLTVDAACASPLASERLVPAVPHESPDQSHAPYTPVAAYPVAKHPAGLSQEIETPLVLTTSLWFTTRHRRFTFVRLYWSIPARGTSSTLWPQRSPPRLFTVAAWSGLKPALGSRLRRTCLHLSRSFDTIR